MADISYTRTTWADGQEGGTAIDATKLNNIEQGIVDAVAAIGPNDTTEDGTLKAQIDQNTSDISDLQDSVYKSTYTFRLIDAISIYAFTSATNTIYANFSVPIQAVSATATISVPSSVTLQGHASSPVVSATGIGWVEVHSGTMRIKLNISSSVAQGYYSCNAGPTFSVTLTF